MAHLTIDTKSLAYKIQLEQLRAIIDQTQMKLRYLSRLSAGNRRVWIANDPLLRETIKLISVIENFKGDV